VGADDSVPARDEEALRDEQRAHIDHDVGLQRVDELQASPIVERLDYPHLHAEPHCHVAER
jgi:hypothetical protein